MDQFVEPSKSNILRSSGGHSLRSSPIAQTRRRVGEMIAAKGRSHDAGYHQRGGLDVRVGHEACFQLTKQAATAEEKTSGRGGGMGGELDRGAKCCVASSRVRKASPKEAPVEWDDASKGASSTAAAKKTARGLISAHFIPEERNGSPRWTDPRHRKNAYWRGVQRQDHQPDDKKLRCERGWCWWCFA